MVNHILLLIHCLKLTKCIFNLIVVKAEDRECSRNELRVSLAAKCKQNEKGN